MFLSKRSNGIYYVHFLFEGRKRRLSTKSKLKSDALKFLLELKNEDIRKRRRKTNTTLTEFHKEYQIYSQSVHTPKIQQSISSAFCEFVRIIGDARLLDLGVRQIERFLATKIAEASEWTARKYYIHLSSAFETAVRWNYLAEMKDAMQRYEKKLGQLLSV